MERMRMIGISFVSFMLLWGCSGEEYTSQSAMEIDGNPIEVNHLQMEFKSEEIRKEVKPDKPQGYYPHYKEQEGYHYHVLYGTLKNIGEETVHTDQFKIKSAYEDETYEGKLVLINEIESYFWDKIAPGAELDFYLFSVVEDGEEAPDEYHFYYDEDQELEKEQNNFDHEIRYHIPDNLEKDGVSQDD